MVLITVMMEGIDVREGQIIHVARGRRLFQGGQVTHSRNTVYVRQVCSVDSWGLHSTDALGVYHLVNEIVA